MTKNKYFSHAFILHSSNYRNNFQLKKKKKWIKTKNYISKNEGMNVNEILGILFANYTYLP